MDAETENRKKKEISALGGFESPVRYLLILCGV